MLKRIDWTTPFNSIRNKSLYFTGIFWMQEEIKKYDQVVENKQNIALESEEFD